MKSPTALIDSLFGSIDRPINFQARPEPIPGDLRLAWRLTALAVILYRSRADKAPLQQISILWWAMRSDAARQRFLRWYRGESAPDEVLVRYDPTVNATIDLSIGLHLVTRESNGTLRLTSTGKTVATRAWEIEGFMSNEKEFLSQLPARMTQAVVRDLLSAGSR